MKAAPFETVERCQLATLTSSSTQKSKSPFRVGGLKRQDQRMESGSGARGGGLRPGSAGGSRLY